MGHDNRDLAAAPARWPRLVAAIWLLAITPVGTAATTDDQDLLDLSLEELLELKINVGTTKPETVLRAASTVTVIDRKMIEDYGFRSVAEAVETVAGFAVVRTYLKRGLATSRSMLQDHYANKVLVMLDGVPAWHAITGEGNLDRVHINDVERIEILKGPASVQYGSQAYSGTVNIILRRPTNGASTRRVVVGGGPDGGLEAGAAFARDGGERLSVLAAVNIRRSPDLDLEFVDESGVAGEIEDFIKARTATLRLGYGNHVLLANAFSNDESYLGVTPKFAAGAGHPQDVDGLLLAYSTRIAWTEATETQLRLFGDWNQRNLSRTADDSVRADIRGRRLGGTLVNTFALNDRLELELGAEYDHRHSNAYRNVDESTDVVLADNNLDDRSVYEYSLFGQLKTDLGRYRLVLGSRWTRNELFGSNISSRGTLALSLDERNTIKLIVSQSFRTPSLFELYFATPTQTVFGNQDLEPETSDSFELAYQFAGEKLYVQATAYHAVYADIISRVIGDVTLPDGTVLTDRNVYTNTHAISANGLEVSARIMLDCSSDAFVNLAVVDGDETDADGSATAFHYAPTFTGAAGVHKRFGGFVLAAVVNHIGRTDGPVASIGSHTTVDLTGIYRHRLRGMAIRHTVALRNLLDQDIDFPEYVRERTVNTVPLEAGFSAFYSLAIEF